MPHAGDLPIPAAASLIWALPFLGLFRLRGRRPAVGDATPATAPAVSVIVPARNESDNIGTLLRSLLAAEYPAFEVVVVDDRSTDDTAAQVSALAARDPRVRLVEGAPLPDGWYGKPWACHQGALQARHDLLLFTDADTTHHPTLLARAVSAHRASAADLYTLTTRLLCESFWERLVMPQVWMILALRYPPHAVNRAKRPVQVVANGQFILMSRERYHAVGGHQAVHDQVVEDLALAQRVVQQGGTVRMEHGDALLATRMYRSLGQMIEGWSKNLAVGSRQSLTGLPWLQPLAPIALLLPFLFWLLPPLVLALHGGIAAAAATALSLCFWGVAMAGMRLPLPYAAGYPLGAAMAGWIALRSVVRGRRRIEWRGRMYRSRA